MIWLGGHLRDGTKKLECFTSWEPRKHRLPASLRVFGFDRVHGFMPGIVIVIR